MPRSLWLDVARACHEEPTSGHEGQEKTEARVRERFWWPGLREYIRKYVAGCPYCQFRKTPRKLPTGPMEFGPTPSLPFREWGIDHLGPFPTTTNRNKYAVVAVDYFSKWVVAASKND